MASEIVIHPAELVGAGEGVRLQSRIKTPDREVDLWYGFEEQYGEFTNKDQLDPFLVGLLTRAMRSRWNIRIEGSISEKLFFNLTNHLMTLYALNNESFHPVEVFPEGLHKGGEGPRPSGVVTGFSAGVDSLCAVRDHFLFEGPESFKLTHLIYNNVGAHGEFETDRARELFRTRFELIRGYPEGLGLPMITVDSNLSDVLGMIFQRSHIPRNGSCALLFPKLFAKYYYASSIHYRDGSFVPKRDMCASESASLHLLSTETLDFILTGGQHTRVEKTRRVAQIEDAGKWLNVCVAPLAGGENCSRCKKCMRTLMTLEILGYLEDFGECFDLGVWAEVRPSYISGTVLRRSKSMLLREIREVAKEVGYRFPARSRIMGKLAGFVPRSNDPEVRALQDKYYGAKDHVKRLLGREIDDE